MDVGKIPTRLVQIINADSKFLGLNDNSVNLTVTSPYYRNAIDYKAHLAGIYYRNKKNHMEVDEYTKIMKEHFLEVFRVTKEGGYCCIIIGNELDNGKMIPLPSYFKLLMIELGWILQDEIIWYKVTGGKKRFRVTVQHPYSTYYYTNLLHEKILVFRKENAVDERILALRSGDTIESYVGDNCEEILIFRKGKIVHRRDGVLEIDDLMKKEISNSAWHIAPVPPNQYPHPCPFPEEIPYYLILLYSCPRDIVLDPFNGIGTTTKVAFNTGRKAVGYDIIQKYCKFAEKRSYEPLNLRDPLIPKWTHLSEWELGKEKELIK